MRGLDGLSGIVGKLRKVQEAGKDARNEGLMVAGLHVLAVSNAKAPIETGELIRSGQVSQDEGTGLTAISYDTDYAVVQHEDMSMNHDDGREAKFLESSLNSESDAVLQIIATSVKRGAGLE